MAINANSLSNANNGLDASLTNQQQVGQFGTQASSWGDGMMSEIMNGVFGSPSQSQDGIGSGSGSGSNNSTSNELMQLMFQLGQMFAELEQLANSEGLGGGNGGSPTSGSGGSGGSPTPEPIYTQASGGSVGDPHQSFTGSSSNGGPVQSGKANDMGSQSDLIDANDSFSGGYQVATQTTTPNSNGITYNSSATVSSNNGWSQVSMGQNGQVSVWDQGQYLNLNKGQSLTLSSGATVSENQAGDVTVDDKNSSGGDISTTLSWNGQGVDVNFNAQNVALGGYDSTLGQAPTAQPQSLVG